jgi:hypothetical protein
LICITIYKNQLLSYPGITDLSTKPKKQTTFNSENVSTRALPTGSETRYALSRSPAHETIRKTIIVCGPPVRVERKNDAVFREYIGYDRLEGAVLPARLVEVYRFLPPLLNFVMPTMKLESKIKVGSKEIKKYDVPHSPYQRLLESVALSPEVKAELTRLCGLYNPVQLQHNVNKAVLALRDGLKLLFSYIN